MDVERKRARARALRAARVLSVAAGLAMGASGCALSHTEDGASRPDARPPIADGGARDFGLDSGPRDLGPRDLGPRDLGPLDSGPLDTGVADAGECPEPTWTGTCCETGITRDCCDTYFGFWDEAADCCMTCVVGPLVPPSAPV